LTTIAALRGDGSAFALALNATVPGPCPDAPAVIFSHAPSALAVHWHSRSVLTVMEPAPPPAGRVEGFAEVVTAHFAVVEGAVDVVAVDPQPAAPAAAASSAANRA
jgi:hypothetical protein